MKYRAHKPPAMHLRHPNWQSDSATRCGTLSPRTTDQLAEVTCGQCRRLQAKAIKFPGIRPRGV